MLRTAICCADNRTPRTDSTKLPYQSVIASQYASATVSRQREPITAAARNVHWKAHQHACTEVKAGGGRYLLTATEMNCTSVFFLLRHRERRRRRTQNSSG